MLLDQRAERPVITRGDRANKLAVLLVRQVRSPPPPRLASSSRSADPKGAANPTKLDEVENPGSTIASALGGRRGAGAAGETTPALLAELLQALFHGFGLGLELRQVRLQLGDHLGLAPEGAVEPVAPAAPAATTTLALPALLALLGVATLALGAMTLVRRVFAVVAMMPLAVMPLAVMPMAAIFALFTAAAHDRSLFRGLT